MNEMKARDVVLAVAAIAIAAFAIRYYKPASEGAGAPTSISDGTISFTVASGFALAVAPEQILVRSYIPPCDENFDYCLYYTGNEYQGTNFESAGIRIKKLAAAADCSAAPYDGLQESSYRGAGYTMTAFGPLGNGAAGHYATGMLYRLAYKGACYEFETRIGEAQFANYPPGAIQKFTDADRAAMLSKLGAALADIGFATGGRINFGQ